MNSKSIRSATRWLTILTLFAGSARADDVDWGKQVLTSVNNLIDASGGAFVHVGLVCIAWAGLIRFLYAIVMNSLDNLDGISGFHVRINWKEQLIILAQIYLMAQVATYWAVAPPGLGTSLHQIPMAISENLVGSLAKGQLDTMLTYIKNVAVKTPQPSSLAVLGSIVYAFILMIMGVLTFVAFILTSFAYIGEAIMVVMAPLFFWCVFSKHCFSWLWNTIQGMFAFATYKVIAAVILYILADLLVYFFVHGIGVDYSIGNWIAMLPIVVMLTGLFIFSLLMVPLIAASIFNGAGAIGQAAVLATMSAAKAGAAAAAA